MATQQPKMKMTTAIPASIMTPEVVRQQAPKEETLTLARDIAGEINGHLNARQDVLLALVLTEQGVTASKVVSSPSEVAVFGITATEEGVVARAGVATPEGVVVADAAAVPVEEEEEADEAEKPADS